MSFPLESIPLYHVGNVFHPETCQMYERIIAGAPIDDHARKSYAKYDHASPFLLQPVGMSGHFGFVDFAEITYGGVEALLVAFLGVEPKYRCNGVASKLVQRVEHLACVRKATSVVGIVDRRQESDIRHFYERRGYSTRFALGCWLHVAKRIV